MIYVNIISRWVYDVEILPFIAHTILIIVIKISKMYEDKTWIHIVRLSLQI